MPADAENNNGSTDPQGQQAPPPADPAKSEAKFTQADIDRVLGERLTRHTTKVETDLLKKLGAATPEEAADLIKKARDAEESQKTAAEKLQSAIDAEKTRAETLEKERNDLAQRLTTTVRNTALNEALKSAGAVNTADALTLLIAANADKTFLKDDAPDAEAIKSAVEALKRDKKYLFASDMSGYRGFGSTRNAGNPNPDQAAADAARKAMRKGLRG